MQTKNLRYFKRYRMDLDLRRWPAPAIALPLDYRLVGWDSWLLEDHAEVKYYSFREEVDATVFPCLGDFESCRELMDEIQAKDGFLPEATWLAQYIGAGPNKTEFCGTIQAIHTQRGRGGIQNLGVTPLHRGRGLGTSLLTASLHSLQQLGLKRARLEVTAENCGAVNLYQRQGFRTIRTLYKAVELAYCL